MTELIISQQVVLRNLLAKKNSFCFYLHCCGWRYPSIYRLTYIALSDIVLFVYFDPLSKPWFLFNLNGVWIFTSFASLISSKRSLLPYCFQFSWNGGLFLLWLKLIYTRGDYVEIRGYFLNRRCQLIVLSANAAKSGGVVS